MRKLMMLAALLAAASMVRAAEADCACFTPGAAEIVAFEERIAELPEPVYHYARYYSGRLLPPVTFRGQTIVPRRIEALYLPLRESEASGIHIVENGTLPPLKGEGCTTYIDTPPENDAFLLHPRCNAPGGWTPSADDIAALELRLTLPKDTAPLARFTRHYAGVTDFGTRLIRGVFVEAADGMGSVRVETEAELPYVLDDGCHVIAVDFNPETNQGSVRCSDRF
jgi:hypothetical protein